MVPVRLAAVLTIALLLSAGCGRSRPALDLQDLDTPERAAALVLAQSDRVRQVAGPSPRVVSVDSHTSRLSVRPLLPHTRREVRQVGVLIEGENGNAMLAINMERRGYGPWRVHHWDVRPSDRPAGTPAANFSTAE